MDIKLLSEVLPTHGRALCMPAREAFAPGAGPAHDVLGLGFLPEGEVQRSSLLILPIKCARIALHILNATSAKLTVVELLVVFLYIKVDRTIAHVGKAGIQYLLS